jgi:DNA-binding transcriptional ArsR family regulator
MPDPQSPGGKVDTERLSVVLSALGNRQRLDILRQLTTPKNVSEIEAHREETAKDAEGGTREVPLTRQAILSHIDKLEEVDLVETRVAQGEGSHTKEYYAREDHLFMVLEEVRTLGNLAMESAAGGVPDRTLVQESEPQTPETEDALAQLVLIRGIREGRVFPLHSKAEPMEWLIGREREVGGEEVDVPLEYDLFISRKHAVLTRESGTFRLRDAESLNGTSVNWDRELRGGDEVELTHGDVIGVGRSLLLFRNP